MMKKSKTITPFTQPFLDSIQVLLVEEKARLEKELGTFTTKNPHVTGDYDAVLPDYGDKDDENAMEVAEYTTNKPLELSLEKTFRDVIKSMDRLADGTYGICKYCDQPIDEKRLMARPTSSACVSCKKTLTDEI